MLYSKGDRAFDRSGERSSVRLEIESWSGKVDPGFFSANVVGMIPFSSEISDQRVALRSTARRS